MGTGIYHTGVQIEGTGIEFAFGGHQVQGQTGIFGLPVVNEGTGEPPPAPMPGMRYAMRLDMGPIFSDPPRPVRGPEDQRSLLSNDEEHELQELVSDVELPDLSRRDLLVLRALNVIEKMRNHEDWHGLQYSLLSRNCNHFSDELVFRLTGRHLPGWINRAASVALALPCLVPQALTDPPSAGEQTSLNGLAVPSGIQPAAVEYEPADMVAPT